MQFYTKTLIILSFLGINSTLFAQNLWTINAERSIQLPKKCVRYTIPQKGTAFSLNLRQMSSLLNDAPLENSRNKGIRIALPLPDGQTEIFSIVESPIMESELAAKFPMIKTYFGTSVSSKSTARLDLTPEGFHGLIQSDKGQIYIDPYATNQREIYISYYLKDLLATQKEPFICGNKTLDPSELLHNDFSNSDLPKRRFGGEPVKLRTYRIAIAANAEFTAYHGGKVSDATAAIVTIVNRLNQIFNVELAIKLVLINNNDKLIFLQTASDGYTNGSTDKMIDENQKIIDRIIGKNGYAWGHVFGTHGSFSGLAQLGAVCSQSKARGVSLSRNPVNDGFVVSIVAHEMGHQMGASHSMSSCHNVFSGTAYEPGSGSTIMSYAGICGFQNNTVTHSDPYYFTHSLQQIKNYMFDGRGNTCASITNTNNTAPSVAIPLDDGFYIPIKTPFVLDAVGTDLENDDILYCWEEYDLGPMSVPGSPEGNSPIFRSFPATEASYRIFPKLENIVNDAYNKAEVLPTYSRDLTFRCTVRDNVAQNGGTSWEKIAFKATSKAGPFKVMFPNYKKDTLFINQITPIRWDVAHTDLDPVNCKSVNIYLSTDGGYTYPTLLAENVPNDGIEYVRIPDMPSNKARIQVKSADNIFFDISNSDFSITPATDAGFSFGIYPDVQHLCLPESAIVNIETSSALDFSEKVQFSIKGELPTDVIANFDKNATAPGTPNRLVLDFSNHLEEGTYTIEIEGKANDELVLTRTLTITTTSNIFSSIEQLTPKNSENTDELPTYSWNPATDADTYLLEVADNPTFNENSIIESTETTASSIVSTQLLDQNTIYYWRVTPINECGKGAPIGTFSFHTNSVSCRTFEQENVNINITQTGKPYKETFIEVFESGTIADVNIPTFHGYHNWFSDLDVSLTSPAGTKIWLFKDKCFNYNGLFSFKLDDQSPDKFSCPPKGQYFRPVEPLSKFNGEDSKGKWTIGIQDDTGGNGGQFGGWSLELCGSISAKSPKILTNNTLPVRPNATRIITSEFLSAEDPDANNDDLQYIIVATPVHGTITRYNKNLGIGDKFTEWELNHNSIIYRHNGDDNQTDSFPFVLKNKENNWAGQHIFNITMDDNAIATSTKDILEQNVLLYPNPASGNVFLELTNRNKDPFSIQLFNIEGQMLLERPSIRKNRIQLKVEHFPNGIYFIKVKSGDAVVTKKLILN